jgi:hypothetical protein
MIKNAIDHIHTQADIAEKRFSMLQTMITIVRGKSGDRKKPFLQQRVTGEVDKVDVSIKNLLNSTALSISHRVENFLLKLEKSAERELHKLRLDEEMLIDTLSELEALNKDNDTGAWNVF